MIVVSLGVGGVVGALRRDAASASILAFTSGISGKSTLNAPASPGFSGIVFSGFITYKVWLTGAGSFFPS